MGFADLICWSASVPEVDADHGLTILDFKTGSVKEEKYRDTGIYLESEFYGRIFENLLDEEITAVAGYYPKSDTVVTSQYPDDERAAFIEQTTREMVALSFHEQKDTFELNEQPLCKWKPSKDNQCEHYERCESSWATVGGPGPSFNEKANPQNQPAGGSLYEVGE